MFFAPLNYSGMILLLLLLLLLLLFLCTLWYGGFAVVNTTVVVVEKNIPVLFKIEFYSNPVLNLFIFE